MTIIQNVEKNSTKSRTRNATFAALQWVREMTLPQGEKVLLFALASRIDNRFRCVFSREVLMQDTGIRSRQSFAKHVESLAEKNLIRVGKHSHKANRWPRNSYELMVPPKYRVKKMDPQSDAQNFTGDAQNLSVDAQKMDPYCLYYYPYNYTVEDIQKDETSGQASYPLNSKNIQDTSGEIEQDVQTSPEVKKTGSAAAVHFPVTVRFDKHKPTNKAKVCHWWECIAKYRPDQYAPHKALTERQSKKLWELYAMFPDKPIRALALIEWCIRHWEAVPQSNPSWQSKPKHPTPTWIVNNIETCTDYFQATSPIKLGPH
tara:strand:- start:4070 stop:5020 length:951 start_codon:yes stop_codon:yes gene_type:complete